MIGIAAMVPVLIFAGFVPRVLVIPDYLHGTVVEDDIRREILRSRRPVRILPRKQYTAEHSRRALFFPGDTERNGEAASHGVALVPRDDRSHALESALSWLVDASPAGVILAVAETDAVLENVDHLMDGLNEIIPVRLDRPAEAELSARRILGVMENSAAEYGVLVVAGEFAPEILRALVENAVEAVPTIVVELFLAPSGSRLRDAGIPLSGAIVSDLAGTLRSLPLRLKKQRDTTGVVYVPAVFFRY